jgi:hypothetical protein
MECTAVPDEFLEIGAAEKCTVSRPHNKYAVNVFTSPNGHPARGAFNPVFFALEHPLGNHSLNESRIVFFNGRGIFLTGERMQLEAPIAISEEYIRCGASDQRA